MHLAKVQVVAAAVPLRYPPPIPRQIYSDEDVKSGAEMVAALKYCGENHVKVRVWLCVCVCVCGGHV